MITHCSSQKMTLIEILDAFEAKILSQKTIGLVQGAKIRRKISPVHDLLFEYNWLVLG